VYLAAVSGGADSVAMLTALAALRDKHPEPDPEFSDPAISGPAFRCLHIEHGIRPREESRGDAEFVRQFCQTLNIPCRVVIVPHGKIAAVSRVKKIGTEATARLYRHGILLREARRLEGMGKTVRILIAHTRTDKLETTLMRFLQGAGPEGLAAMPRLRGYILRPLLSLERTDVLCYLRDKNVRWREDASNQDERFLRNRIRRSLVPVLDDKFPGWRSALDALAQTQRLAAGFIAQEAASRVSWKRADAGVFCTDADNFFSQPAVIREEALFRGIDALLKDSKGHAAVKRAAVRQFCTGRFRAADLGPARALRGTGHIRLKRSGTLPFETGFSLLIKEPGLYTLKGITIEVSDGLEAGASQSRPEGTFAVQLPLVLRRCMKADSIVLNGKKSAAAKMFTAAFRKRVICALDQQGPCAFVEPDSLKVWACSGTGHSAACYMVSIGRRGTYGE
jgi:tRNA(Ile)-lysidine synthase